MYLYICLNIDVCVFKSNSKYSTSHEAQNLVPVGVLIRSTMMLFSSLLSILII
jgi:hypothetical protein